MKSNTFFKLFIIITIAFLFRVWNLDKPEGLWNDEYVSWYIASEKDITKFFTYMFRNCHAPLYYIYLKIWMFLFNNSDICLRISSVIPSIFTVITMFFVGKEVKDEKFGLFTALLTTISSFYIYFAQEVRLYSLLGFFSALNTLYFIKVTKEQTKLNFTIYFISNILICSTHTLGIIYSYFNILFLLLYLNMYKDKYTDIFKNILQIIKYISPILLILVLLLPFLLTVTFSNSLSQFWSNFSIARIIYCLTDFFSPIQTNIVNSSDNIISYIFANKNVSFKYITFALTPTLLALVGIINAIKLQNKNINYLLYASISFFIVLVFLSMTGRIILLTKYTSEILPILIIFFALGVYSFKIKYLKEELAIIYIFLCLFYLYCSADSVPKRTRPEGHLAVINLIKASELKQNDIVILTYYDKEKFIKYLNKNDNYRFYSINKYNFNKIVFNNDNFSQTIKNGKVLYKDNFKQFPNTRITNHIKYNYEKDMKKGDRIGVIFLDSVSFIPNKEIQKILEDQEAYKRTPFIFLVFSTIKNNILYAFKDDYKIETITQAGDWTLFVFQKVN